MRQAIRKVHGRKWDLTAEFFHRLIKTAQCQLEHALRTDQLTDQLDGAGIFPGAFLDWIQPDKVRISLDKTLDPETAGLVVPVLDRAAGIGDLINIEVSRQADKTRLSRSSLGLAL